MTSVTASCYTTLRVRQQHGPVPRLLPRRGAPLLLQLTLKVLLQVPSRLQNLPQVM